ncbi:MAG: class F sortase [Candidatus Dormibacteraceae bacterium]
MRSVPAAFFTHPDTYTYFNSRETPLHLLIPSLNIDSSIESVGTVAQGQLDAGKEKCSDAGGCMQVPSTLANVAWYQPGVAPAQDGDAVIAGHKDNVQGAHGVFWSLGSMKVGDEVDVTTQTGHKLIFKVTSNQTVSSTANTNQIGLFATSGQPRLTLITCTGAVNASRTAYLQRLIVDTSYQRMTS